ncbi:MAG: response regulator, partial [Lachnospiraceae bacterium]|nr:response regulator [Lachnospiraceae bacterium]
IMEAVCRRLKLNEKYVKKEAGKEDSGKKRILVVDDNGTALRTMKAMLQDVYEVDLAISGAQAMTSIGKNRPDLILLDYEMPICDGKMTLEMIRADEDMKDIPVIFLTAINDRANIEAVLKLKPAGYFLKPPVKDRLVSEINKILG